MHGTHVAGIIGVVGNNEKESQERWNVKICQKAFHLGRGNATDIALKAIMLGLQELQYKITRLDFTELTVNSL